MGRNKVKPEQASKVLMRMPTLRSLGEGRTCALQMHQNAEIRWVEASYTAIHHVLTNPV